MVEAPGYCPPGPKCLFHPIVYRHSRRTGTREIGIFHVNLKDGPVMPELQWSLLGNANS